MKAKWIFSDIPHIKRGETVKVLSKRKCSLVPKCHKASQTTCDGHGYKLKGDPTWRCGFVIEVIGDFPETLDEILGL